MLELLEILLWPFDFISRWRIALCLTLAIGAVLLIFAFVSDGALAAVLCISAVIGGLVAGIVWDSSVKKT